MGTSLMTIRQHCWNCSPPHTSFVCLSFGCDARKLCNMGGVLTSFFFCAFVLGPWVSVYSLNQVVKELQNTVQGLEDIKVLLKELMNVERDVLETLESIKDVGKGKVVPDHANKFE